MASESVDLVITDPPYESLEKHRAVGTTTRLKHSKSSSNDWFEIFPNSRFPELFREVFRVLRRDRHFYLFCDQETMFVAKPLAEEAGFKFWKPLVWDKMKIGMGYHYRARHEFILFFEKGKRKLNNLGLPDVISVPRVFRGYPTEKPVGVSEVLIEQSSRPEEMVVDPFVGAGGVGVAAVRAGRHFRGNDIRPRALDISRTRLAEAACELVEEPPAHPARSGRAPSTGSRGDGELEACQPSDPALLQRPGPSGVELPPPPARTQLAFSLDRAPRRSRVDAGREGLGSAKSASATAGSKGAGARAVAGGAMRGPASNRAATEGPAARRGAGKVAGGKVAGGRVAGGKVAGGKVAGGRVAGGRVAGATGAAGNESAANRAVAKGAAVNGAAVNGAAVNGAAVNGAAVNGAAVNGAAHHPALRATARASA